MARNSLLVLASLLVAGGCSTGASSPSAVPASPAPASAAASAGSMEVMGSGTLQAVDGTASGTAQLVVLPDGTYEVVLEDFSITSTAHTNVVLVKNESVTATADIDKSMLLDLGPLTSASGMQVFPIPASMNATVGIDYHSVVIWDTEMAHAIAAAPLR